MTKKELVDHIAGKFSMPKWNAEKIVSAIMDCIHEGAARDGVAYVKKLFVSRPDRALVRARAAQAALELVLRLAQGKVPAGTQALTAAQQSDDEALAALDEAFVR